MRELLDAVYRVWVLGVLGEEGKQGKKSRVWAWLAGGWEGIGSLVVACLFVWFAGWRYRGPVDQDNSYDYGGGGRLGLVAVCNLGLLTG
jgi:hypothetical protein